MNNGRPLTRRKVVQLLVIVTILVWATQTLLTQWGYGAEAVASPAETRPLAVYPADEAPKFVPSDRRSLGSTLELRSEATVNEGEVRLKQLCRWSEADADMFLPIADLVIAKFHPQEPYRGVSMDELKSTLRDAGLNLAFVRFSGPTQCMINRTDVRGGGRNEGVALEQWINAAQGNAGNPTTRPVTLAASVPEAQPAAAQTQTATLVSPESPLRTLRHALTDDLAIRLGLPADQVQLAFNPKDDRVLSLCEPQFRFHLVATKVRNLGDVSWDVTLAGDIGSQKVNIGAIARMWQKQVVTTRPLGHRQMIRAEDVIESRVLVDRLPETPLLTMPQIVHQQAAREIQAGTIMTAKLVEAVPLARPGQFITITLDRGGFRVKTVARAMEGGSYGQTIKARNEATGDVYQVTLVAPQEGTMSAPSTSADPRVAAVGR